VEKISSTVVISKPLVALFQAPLALHPHRFRKNFVWIMSLFRKALLRRALKQWNERARSE
ncbi:unnamed protein product, partial [Amoebophrya sp. A25]